MTSLRKREITQTKPVELVPWFDRLFDDWFKFFSYHRPFTFVGGEWTPENLIRVDEFQDNGSYVIRAELPGIDPDKDVELSLSDDMLHITATRREEDASENKGYMRQEIRCGSFHRTIPLPAGVAETDVTASYEDGILEVRIPRPKPAKKIPVATT